MISRGPMIQSGIPHPPCRRLFVFQQTLPSRPGVFASLVVGLAGIGSFPGAHKSMARPIVGYRVVGFTGRLHTVGRPGNGGPNTRVVAGIESVDRGLDASHRVCRRWRSIEDKCGRKITSICGEAKGLPATPTKAGDKELPACRRNL